MEFAKKYILIFTIELIFIALICAAIERSEIGNNLDYNISYAGSQETYQTVSDVIHWDIEKMDVTSLDIDEAILNSEGCITKYYSDEDVIELAKLLFAECYAVEDKTEQACVAWTVVNRCDLWERNIHETITAPYQYAYSDFSPVMEDMIELSNDVLYRWSAEKCGVVNSGRVLPKEYIYFIGDGEHNYFYYEYPPAAEWTYELDSPYEK